VCQGGTLLTGAPAAASGRGGGEPSGVRGARYGTGPWIGRAGSGCVRRPPSPMPRHAPRRMRELEAGLPSEEGGSEKVDTPPKGPRIYLGRQGVTHCHSRKNARATCLRAGDVVRPLALPPQNSSQTTGTRASMQLKKEVRLLCKEDAVLTSTFRRARTGTEVAVTSKRVCGADGVPHARS